MGADSKTSLRGCRGPRASRSLRLRSCDPGENGENNICFLLGQKGELQSLRRENNIEHQSLMIRHCLSLLVRGPDVVERSLCKSSYHQLILEKFLDHNKSYLRPPPRRLCWLLIHDSTRHVDPRRRVIDSSPPCPRPCGQHALQKA